MHFKQDFRQGMRLLAREPAFTTVAVLVLALGIGVNTAVFSLVNAMLLRPLIGVAPDRLVGLYSREKTKPDSYRGFSYPDYRDLREQGTVFDGLMAHNFAMLGLGEGETTRRVFAAVVSSNYFSTLGVHLARGRAFSQEEEEPGSRIPVAVVSFGFWKKAGADPSLVGRTVRLNGQDFTVIGVAPEGFSGTMALLSPEVWIPLGMYDATLNDFQRRGEHARLADRQHRNLVLVGRLRDGLSVALARPQIEAAGERLAQAFPAENKDQALSLAPLPRLGVSTAPRTNGEVATAGGLLMAMASLVLLIACLNLANMLLARGAARRQEIAIRLALGASRGRIAGQLLTEGLVLSLVGGAAGLLLAYCATRVLVSSLAPIVPLALVFDATPDVRVLAATLGFCMLSTVFFGLGPAWNLSRTDVLPPLKERAGEPLSRSSRNRRIAPRNLLVSGQVALSLALLTTGGLFVRGGLAAADSNPGFRLDQGLVVEVDPALAGEDEIQGRAAYASSLDRLRSTPGVEAVSLASTVPFGPFSISRMVQPAESAAGRDGAVVDAQYVIVGADYFRALGLPVLRGREFARSEESSAAGPRPALVDEPLARRLWPDQDPVGRYIKFAPGPEGEKGEPLEIVGIVPGLRHSLFDPSPVPHVYVPFGSHYQSGMNVHVRLVDTDARSESAMIATVRAQIRAADARLPVLSATTLHGYHDSSLFLWLVRTGARLFSLFGVVALFLAVVGVYGVKSYVVARRTREIGIRMALGATPASVLRLVLREGFVVTAVGIGLGLVLGVLSGRLVGSLLYQVSPTDPVVFSLAPAVLAVAALAAAYLPARRATRITPTAALRHQ